MFCRSLDDCNVQSILRTTVLEYILRSGIPENVHIVLFDVK